MKDNPCELSDMAYLRWTVSLATEEARLRAWVWR